MNLRDWRAEVALFFMTAEQFGEMLLTDYGRAYRRWPR